MPVLKAVYKNNSLLCLNTWSGIILIPINIISPSSPSFYLLITDSTPKTTGMSTDLSGNSYFIPWLMALLAPAFHSSLICTVCFVIYGTSAREILKNLLTLGLAIWIAVSNKIGQKGTCTRSKPKLKEALHISSWHPVPLPGSWKEPA